MDAHLHDKILGAVSHLPHVAAFALINALTEIRDQQIPSLDLASHSGGGLRDTTRIAASSPEMWRDIFLWNRDNVVTFIEAYERSLSQLKQLIHWAMLQASRRNLNGQSRNGRNFPRDRSSPRSTPMASLTITPGRPLQGTISVPGDKSITHRAIILTALANGVSTIARYCRGEDCLNTMRAFQDLGVRIDESVEELRVYGKGLWGLTESSGPIDCGNSGTGIRLLTGLLAGQDFFTVLTGDESIRRRPNGADRQAVTGNGGDHRRTQGWGTCSLGRDG